MIVTVGITSSAIANLITTTTIAIPIAITITITTTFAISSDIAAAEILTNA